MATTAEVSTSARAKYEPVIGLEVHVQLLTTTQDFLLMLHEIRQPSQHECLPGLSGIAGRTACPESQGGRVRDAGGNGHQLPHQRDFDLRSQELFLS